MNKKDKLIEIILYGLVTMWGRLCLFLLLFTSCGEISDLQPNITVVNFVPPGVQATGECDDCPTGPRVLNFIVADRTNDTWAIGLQFENGCAEVLKLNWAVAGFWEKTASGDWIKRPEHWVLPIADYGCFQNVAFWENIGVPCPGEYWCSLDNFKIELLYNTSEIYVQLWTTPVEGF